MTHPDKLLSIEYCDRQSKALHRYPAEQAVYKQLADTMRENERIKRVLRYVENCIPEGEELAKEAVTKAIEDYRILKPNKHSDHIADAGKMVGKQCYCGATSLELCTYDRIPGHCIYKLSPTKPSEDK